MIEIYGLYDPFTGELRYVGKAKSAAERLKKHYQERNLNRPVNKWFKKVVESGGFPCAQVLEVVADDEWEAAERRLIAKHRRDGNLLNLADGGAMPSQTKEQRQGAARAAYKASISDPARAKLNHAKRECGKLLASFMKKGYYSHAYLLRFRMKLDAARSPELFGSWANL